ncbi:MAG: hypothetical protein QM811_29220 [Pirellulales bacterium]
MLSPDSPQFWYCVPLALTIILVYSATRFEDFGSIARHALKSFVWMGAFSVIAFVLLRWITLPL